MNLKSIKETFAKVFETPDRVNFRNLMKDLTGEYNDLEFKQQLIEYSKLAKHILAMANTNGGIICFGVSEKDNRLEPTGLDKTVDSTKIKEKLRKYLPHELEYETCPINYDENVEWRKLKNKSFLMIIIEFTPEHIPFLPMKDADYFKRTTILCRAESSSRECTYNDLKDIFSKRVQTNTSTALSSRDLEDLRLLYNYRVFTTFGPYQKYQELYDKKVKIILEKIK